MREVLQEDLRAHNRDYRSILTFMTRMSKKGWLRVENEGSKNSYSPTVAESTAMSAEIERFLDEVVGRDSEHLRLLRQHVAQAERSRRARRSSVREP